MRRSFVVIALSLATTPLQAQIERPAETEPAQRRALYAWDAGAALASWNGGFAPALLSKMSEDALILLEGAPVVRGRADIERLLNAQRGLAGARVRWEPLRMLVSQDLTLGITFGTVAVQRGDTAPTPGRYVSVWRRSAGGAWQLVAHVVNGLAPRGVTLVEGIGGIDTPEPRDPFADADRAFAQLARDSTAPVAFERFAAPDAITFGGPELNVGPRTIRARMAESGAGQASWRWRPVATVAAPSGDLGATIGEAEITSPRGDVFRSKYVTIWQRQTDGSLKYVVDAGNGRR